MRSHNLSRLFALCTFALYSQTALGLDSVDARVIVLEPTYMPTRVSFMVSVAPLSCPAGNWLSWQSADTANNKAVYGTLLAAITARKMVRIFMKDGCEVGFIHLLEHDAS